MGTGLTTTISMISRRSSAGRSDVGVSVDMCSSGSSYTEQSEWFQVFWPLEDVLDIVAEELRLGIHVHGF